MATEIGPRTFKDQITFLAGVESGHNAGPGKASFSYARVTKAMSGATVTCTGLIPPGCILLGVAIRVDVAVTGATGINVGDGVTPDRWGSNISVALNSVSDLRNTADATPPIFATAQDVVLTAVTSNFTAGSVVVEAHYISVLAA